MKTLTTIFLDDKILIMSDILTSNKNKTLSVLEIKDQDIICKIGKALSIPERVEILRSILNSSKSVTEIANELNMPPSSVARHIEVLTDAQLIVTSYQPGMKGHTKFCSQTILGFSISMNKNYIEKETTTEYKMEMPLGLFSHCHIKEPCGILGREQAITPYDEPNSFFTPDRIGAECIWFNYGFISYNFPLPTKLSNYKEMSFSFEVCSETIYYNNVWRSDITVLLNDIEVITFLSPGDFGGRRGKYTPNYWPITSTQFGVLKKITITEKGVYLDNILVNNSININDIIKKTGSSIKFTIGVKEDAIHRGGINLFGKNFGDYPQSIIMALK